MNNKCDAKSLFDRLASEYDNWYQTPLGALSDALEQQVIFALTGEVEGRIALDASCGTGNYALAMVRNGARVTAVDAAAPMLVLAQAKARREGLSIRLVQTSLERLPFRSGSFGVTTCILALEFAADPPGAVTELGRVQSPGGRLVIGALGRFSLWTLSRRFKAIFQPSLWRHAHFFSRRELGGLLARAGYDRLREGQAIFFPPVNSARLLAGLRRLESVGRCFVPDMAAFLAVAGCREEL